MSSHTTLRKPRRRCDLESVNGYPAVRGREADHSSRVIQKTMFRFDARAQHHDIWHHAHAARAKHCPPFVDRVECDGRGEPPSAQGDQVWSVCGHFNGTALILHDSESLRTIRSACGRRRDGRGGGRGIGIEVRGRGGGVAGEREGAAAHWPTEAWARGGIDG